MSSLLRQLAESQVLPFSLAAGVLASLACGIVGSYVVVRRISYVAGGMAHCVLGGMGLAYYLNRVAGIPWLQPLHGAVAAALMAALTIGLVSLRSKENEDTVISALWAVGMATGVLFIAMTPGYSSDLMSFLFGTISIVSRGTLYLLACLDFVVVVVGAAFYKQFLALCFDEDWARVRGLNVEFYYLLLLCLTALAVILLVQVVGLIMTIALLTLPAATARRFSLHLWQMMLMAIFLGTVFTTSGTVLAYGTDLPAGPVIILLAAGTYLAVMMGGRFVHFGAERLHSRKD